MRCVALTEQQSLRDLSQLAKLTDELSWISADKLPIASGLAVICGLWLQDGGEAAVALLRKRCEVGLVTLLVPRFKAGNLAGLLGAPSAIEVKPGDFSEIVWCEGSIYSVSGVSHFKTSLHAGNWAKAEAGGTTVLGFRTHATAGPIILCSASLTSRPLGIKFEEQQRLFDQIVSCIAAMGVVPKKVESDEPIRTVSPLGIEAFLDEFGEQGASLLLALVASNGDREADLAVNAQKAIGLRLTDETVGLLKQLEETPLPGIESALQKYGWGAYLRRLM